VLSHHRIFESESPYPGASYRVPICGLGKAKTELLETGHPFVSRCVLPSIAAALRPLLPQDAGYSPPDSLSSLHRRLL
jgi:hypothetical protein